jgi:hypothetical protein
VQVQLADEINVSCDSAAAVLRYKLHAWYLLRGEAFDKMLLSIVIHNLQH